MFKLKIETFNDAFDQNPHSEIARILELTASNLEHGRLQVNETRKLIDINGNSVGSVQWVSLARAEL